MKTLNFKRIFAFLLLILSSFLGLVGVFTIKNKQINAEIAGISYSGDWSGDNTTCVYSTSVTGGSFLSKSKSVNITIPGKGKLTFYYTNTVGTLTAKINNTSLFEISGDATNVKVEIVLRNDSNTLTLTCKAARKTTATSKVEGFTLDTSAVSKIETGSGSDTDPYLIKTEADLQEMNFDPGAVYKLNNDITISEDFYLSPIGTVNKPFTGKLLGNNKQIIGLKNSTTSYNGLFGYTNGGTIENLSIVNANISSTGYAGFLIGYAKNGTVVNNVKVNGTLTGINAATYLGGIVGRAETSSAVVATGCVVEGTIWGGETAHVVGGFSGAGGTFKTCEMKATVAANKLVGGFTGGYFNEKMAENAKFESSYFKGEVKLIGKHANNYPYFGIMNGYGAWETFSITSSGIEFNVNFTSTKEVDEVTIFNGNKNASGLVVSNITKEGNNYSFTQKVGLDGTYALAGIDLWDIPNILASGSIPLGETDVTGVTSNYGGLIFRFKLNNGTYKYFSNLNRKTNTFVSNVSNLNLDSLTSYVDNFSNIVIDENLGTDTIKSENNYSVWGAAKITNANDLEHLSWIINGGIPTTIGGKKYNSRSVATISISLQNDIDLTKPRYARFNGTTTTLITEEEYNKNSETDFILNAENGILNEDNSNLIFSYYGLGQSEMHPYRGSIYGNNKTLTVKMQMGNCYLTGIINASTEQNRKIYIKDLTLNGEISGGVRVGIVGTLDNFERTCSIEFNNVINNAKITGYSEVGGLIGESHDNAEVLIYNCVNNGEITATHGNAGGLIGSLSFYTTAPGLGTLNNSTNNGKITASGVAGGLIGDAKTVNLVGKNVNAGVISAPTRSYYVGKFMDGGAYSRTEGATLVVKYTIDVGTPDFTYNVTLEENTTTYTANENGLFYIELLEKTEINNISVTVKSPLTILTSETFNLDDTKMITILNMPKAIILSSSNVYETTNDNWQNLKAVVTFRDNTTQEISLTPNITEDELKTNQLIFVNTSFSNNSYVISSDLVKTLKRLTKSVKDFETLANSLVTKESGTNQEFLTLGTSVKTQYETLKTEIEGYSTNDLTRFNNYLSNSLKDDSNNDVNNLVNKDVGYTVLNNYFENIIKSEDLTNLNNVSVNHGVYSFDKTITLTNLNNVNKNLTLTYTYSKNNSLINTAKTNGATLKVNNIVTYSFNKDINITINKINFSVELSSEELFYNGNKHEVDITYSGIVAGDNVSCMLTYENVETLEKTDEPIEAGTYNVLIKEVIGNDVIYYNTPSVNEATLTINKVSYRIDITSNEEIIYNKQQQYKPFILTKISESDYILDSENDYLITFCNLENEEVTPINVGNYKTVVTFKNTNLTFSGSNEVPFEIKQREITDVTINNSFVYKKEAPTFTFTNFVNLIFGDEVTVNYEILNEIGEVSDGINKGDYTLVLKEIYNEFNNYKLGNIRKSFNVTESEITITLTNEETSVYGEDLKLNNVGYILNEGIVYGDDDLKLEVLELDNLNVGTHTLNAKSLNPNYKVTVNPTTYVITQKEISLGFIEKTEYGYNATNMLNTISNVDISEVLENDKLNFTFNLYYEEEITSTSSFRNVGTYKLELVENETTNNYKISKKKETYKINKHDISLTVKSLTKGYLQEILDTEFDITPNNLLSESLSEILDYEFVVSKGEVIYTDYNGLNVDDYTISLNITKKTQFDNYNISITNGTLKITEKSTFITINSTEKFYDNKPVVFSVDMFSGNEKLTDVNFTYTILKDGSKISINEMKDACTYNVTVVADAGDNYEVCEETFNYVIKTNVINIMLNNNSVIYNGNYYVPSYEVIKSAEADLTNILSYKFLDKNKNEITDKNGIKNADNYFIEFVLNNNENNNFAFATDQVFAVIINAINVSVKLENFEISYKDNYDLTKTKHTITGNVLSGENLNLEFKIINFKEVVGTYVLTVENKNPNYTINKTDASFIVNPRVLSLTYSGNTNLIFNPNGQANLINVTVNNVVTENAVISYYENEQGEKETPLNAGKYLLKTQILDTHNYVFEDNTESVKEIYIDKLVLELNLSLNNKIYDGEIISKPSVKVNNEDLSESLYIVKYYLNKDEISAPKNANKYSVKICEKDERNYLFRNNVLDFEIFTKELTIKDISSEYVYNRKEIKPILELKEPTNDAVNLSVTYSSDNNNFSEVGDYKIIINGLTGADKNNYHLNASEYLTYKIIPCEIEVEVNNSEFTFTNTQIKQDQLNLQFKGDLKVLETDYKLSTLPTFAGEHEINLTSLNFGINFNINSFKIYVNKAEIAGVEFNGKNVVYNGEAHSLEITNLTLENGIVLSVDYSENSFKDVGSYYVYATLSNENYNSKTLSATLNITERNINVAVSENNSFIYNKNQQGIEILGYNDLWYKNLITFNYVGENYNSVNKPIKAGNYKLVIKANNENNIKIQNPENNFVINKKAVVVTNLLDLTYTYNAENYKFTPNISGVVSGDEVIVKCLYNSSETLPKDVNNYIVSFDSLTGKDCENYYLQNNNATLNITILPYLIKVTADNKTMVYGDKNVALTYTHDKLLPGGSFSGELVREEGNNVNSYFILQGTLTLGNNYEIEFTSGIYSITQREITINNFNKEFVYNASSQVPEVTFNNILSKDKNVVSVVTEGDTINCGSYELKIIVNNANYKLRDSNIYNISITKKDISDKILRLLKTEKDYDGLTVLPIVLIDGDYDYNLTYLINNEEVSEIKNAGSYIVRVDLSNLNYKGTKEFSFVVNKINYSNNILENIEVEVHANKLVVLNLNNICVSTSNESFSSGNIVTNLTPKTTYSLFVKVLESLNYKETIFNLGEFITSPSAEKINSDITEILQNNISFEVISKIKEVYLDVKNLTTKENEILNKQNYSLLQEKFDEYINSINKEIEEVNNISNIVDFSNHEELKTILYLNLFVGAILMRKKEKNKNEKED